MRRKKGALIPLELSVLVASLDLKTRGVNEVHGFLMAKQIRDRKGARMLTAHGTLYKALGRMEKAGLLKSRWEDPVAAAAPFRFGEGRDMNAWPAFSRRGPHQGLGSGLHGGASDADPRRTKGGDRVRSVGAGDRGRY